MTFETVFQIAQLLGVVAVVASVIFLAIETRLASQSRQMDAYALASGRMIQCIGDLKRDSELMDIYAKGLADFHSLNQDQQWRFGAMMQEFMTAFRTTWVISGAGRNAGGKISDDEIFGLRVICSRPGFQTWWKAGRNVMPPDFAAYVDRLVAMNAELGTPKFSFPKEEGGG